MAGGYGASRHRRRRCRGAAGGMCRAGQTLEAVVGPVVVVPELLAFALEPYGELQPLAHVQRVTEQHEGEDVGEAIARVLHVVCLQVGVASPSVQRVPYVHRLVKVQIAHTHRSGYRLVDVVRHGSVLQGHLLLPDRIEELGQASWLLEQRHQ